MERFSDVTREGRTCRDRLGTRSLRGDYDNDGWEDLYITY